MLTHPTHDRLVALGLTGMAKALEEQRKQPDIAALSFEERIALMVDREAIERENKRLVSRLKFASLRQSAVVEDVDMKAPRGLDKALFARLVAGDWIARHQSLLICGPTGTGKSWLACALGHKACRDDRSVLYHRVPRLFDALALGRGDGRHARLLKSLARVELLILDDWGLATLTAEQGRDILEITVRLQMECLSAITGIPSGAYEPKPVRRVEIPKPDGGGVRKLGIPTVLDRFIQQAVMQVLQRRWDPTFSPHSYGFRPGRSAHQAVAQAQQYIAVGYGWVIDLDLEKFFDRVNHDKLMGQIAKRVEDKRLLKLTRAFLNAGVMENGLVSPSVEGTPQGGPLSPLLSNLVLDELDRELEHRGHRFVRYADDANIYVRSERAGLRVMESITRFITQKLKLKVNESKSAVARPQERKFLGFSFTAGPDTKRTIAPKSLERFKRRIREITRRAKGVSIKTTMEELASYMRGWRGYFGFCETPEVLIALTRWVRLRMRSALWRQWKTPRRRRAALIALRVSGQLSSNTAGSGRGPWYLARSKALSVGLSNAYFKSLGLPALFETR